ncbi:flavin reductase family protein [Mucilaginibacter aquatilis]|uniref:Flavin reductase family protein n=1 Tax=Mucilaginibacter aquatilis TaxID=1517760 RepID=A0A6I4IBI9_9SPHI|nr:flavin reductase [Mucilaginibacter aquatilis]MVN91298.1 flavin reductase family protein [Mucilaginibacter aquatilis]
MTVINAQQIDGMEKAYRTALMNSITGYKPLNLLGTVNNDNRTNLCIVSSVFHMGSNPSLLGMVIRPERPHNDTLKNIKITGEYTLNNVMCDFYKEAHQTSASYESGVSEFDECGFDEYYHEGFKSPFVRQSSLKIGLRLQEMIDVKLNGTTIVIGKVELLIANDEVIQTNGDVDHIIAGSAAGSGLDAYFKTVQLDKLAYAKPERAPASIL